MKDSIGGVYALTIVFFFIVIISGFIAFTVNYNKAFKMKNRIINILEKYDNNTTSSEVQRQIREYAQEIGYSASTTYTSSCNGQTYTLDSNNTGWCYQEKKTSSGKTNGTVQEYVKKYVNVKTFVSIDIPILNYLFPHIRFFTVDGSTKEILTVND